LPIWLAKIANLRHFENHQFARVYLSAYNFKKIWAKITGVDLFELPLAAAFI